MAEFNLTSEGRDASDFTWQPQTLIVTHSSLHEDASTDVVLDNETRAILGEELKQSQLERRYI